MKTTSYDTRLNLNLISSLVPAPSLSFNEAYSKNLPIVVLPIPGIPAGRNISRLRDPLVFSATNIFVMNCIRLCSICARCLRFDGEENDSDEKNRCCLLSRSSKSCVDGVSGDSGCVTSDDRDCILVDPKKDLNYSEYV